MRKLALLAAFVCLISYCGMRAEAAEPTWSTGAVAAAHFVGPSKATTDGNSHGTVGMNALCQTTFGPTAHICSADEFFQSAAVKIGILTLQPMWVRPSLLDCLVETSGGAVSCRSEEVGRLPESTLSQSCSSEFLGTLIPWTSNDASNAGWVVSGTIPSGAMLSQHMCGIILPPACCAP